MDNEQVMTAITRHAARMHPKECCGLVVKRAGAFEVLEAENISHTPYQSFMIDPVFYRQHMASVVFVYHSHPNRSAYPSEADKASSERLKVPFVIVSSPGEEIFTYQPTGYVPPLLGRQFVYGIFDCYSLVRDVYKARFGIELKDYERLKFGWWETSPVSWFEERYADNGFTVVESPQHGDVILMRLGKTAVPNHVGVYTTGGLLLHHSVHMLSAESVYGGYWRKHTIRVLRHASHC